MSNADPTCRYPSGSTQALLAANYVITGSGISAGTGLTFEGVDGTVQIDTVIVTDPANVGVLVTDSPDVQINFNTTVITNPGGAAVQIDGGNVDLGNLNN